jgi:hypothetical protein
VQSVTDETPGSDIARRDELLELLYWFEGEGFRGAATFDAIVRFLAQPAEVVRATLEVLLRLNEIVYDAASGEYRLTETGRREGARRFADEFAPLLGQGHGECNDPDCGCHEDPGAAAECHGARRVKG